MNDSGKSLGGPTRCPVCDYDLTGLADVHRCPKCGLHLDMEVLVCEGKFPFSVPFYLSCLVLVVTGWLLFDRYYLNGTGRLIGFRDLFVWGPLGAMGIFIYGISRELAWRSVKIVLSSSELLLVNRNGKSRRVNLSDIFQIFPYSWMPYVRVQGHFGQTIMMLPPFASGNYSEFLRTADRRVNALRNASARCHVCGYNLSGLPEAYTCPECAFEYDPSVSVIDEQHFSFWSYGVFGAATLIVGLTLAGPRIQSLRFGSGGGSEIALFIAGTAIIWISITRMFRAYRQISRHKAKIVLTTTGVTYVAPFGEAKTTTWGDIARIDLISLGRGIRVVDQAGRFVFIVRPSFFSSVHGASVFASEARTLMQAGRDGPDPPNT